MVLDFLVSPSAVRKDPWMLVVATFVFVSFGVLVELHVPIQGSIIIFAMVPLIPLIWQILVAEEDEEEKQVEAFKAGKGVLRLFWDHVDLWEVFAFFFLGATLAYTFWFAILPPTDSAVLFAPQLTEVQLIQGSIIGGRLTLPDTFTFLFQHNLQVLGLMLIFSLIYGIGSIYLLLWNASIIGVVLGGKIHALGPIGLVTGFLGLLPHGIFELSAYFLASIGGGLLSMELMKSGLKKPVLFRHVFLDVLVIIGVSLVLLAIGAAVEASY